MSYPTNFAVANSHRAVEAALVELVRVCDALRDLTDAPEHVMAAGYLRLDHPTASYAELATIAGLTKDQVRSRIRQLLHLADRQRQEYP